LGKFGDLSITCCGVDPEGGGDVFSKIEKSILENDSKPTDGSEEASETKPLESSTGSDKHRTPDSKANCKCDHAKKENPHPLEWAIGILLFFTLVATGLAARFTYDQAVTADDSEKRSLRAYIGIVHPPNETMINAFFPPVVPTAVFDVKNFGQTPAYKVTFLGGMGIGPYPLPPDQNFAIENPGTAANPIIVFPGMLDIGRIKSVSKRALTDDEISSIQDGKTKRLYAFGTISYADAFARSHYTNYCIGFYDLKIGKIDYEPCNYHNDSDQGP